MKRLMIDLPKDALKIGDWEVFRRTVVVMAGVSVYLVCILPLALLIVWFLITALVGPLF